MINIFFLFFLFFLFFFLQLLPIPELVPFRLTNQFTQFLSPLDIGGLLGHNMVHTLTALRKKKVNFQCLYKREKERERERERWGGGGGEGERERKNTHISLKYI